MVGGELLAFVTWNACCCWKLLARAALPVASSFPEAIPAQGSYFKAKIILWKNLF